MLDFMDYIQRAFFAASKWNIDNSYSSLNTTAEGTRPLSQFASTIRTDHATDILDFPTPKGVHVTISSLATPHFSTSYTLALSGPVTGTLSYLYSSIPLTIPSSSASTPLSSLIRGYRHLLSPPAPEHPRYWEIWL